MTANHAEQARERLDHIRETFAHGHGQNWSPADLRLFDSLVSALASAEQRAQQAEDALDRNLAAGVEEQALRDVIREQRDAAVARADALIQALADTASRVETLHLGWGTELPRDVRNSLVHISRAARAVLADTTVRRGMSLRWPEVGEVFESRDSRDDGLRVTVIEVNYDKGMVRIKRFNRVWVKITNFRRLYRGPVAAVSSGGKGDDE